MTQEEVKRIVNDSIVPKKKLTNNNIKEIADAQHKFWDKKFTIRKGNYER